MSAVPAFERVASGPPARHDPLPSDSVFVGQILHGVPVALLILDGWQRVVFVNCAAAAFLAGSGDMRLARDRLVAAAPADQKRLESLLSKAPGAREPLYLRLGRNEKNQAWLQARGVPHRGDSCAYILLVLGNARAGLESKHDALRQLFSLSKSEADITVDLALGETAAQIAHRRVVSVHTVRTQIRSALQKSGSERIVDLIRTVASAPGSDTLDDCGCAQHVRSL